MSTLPDDPTPTVEPRQLATNGLKDIESRADAQAALHQRAAQRQGIVHYATGIPGTVLAAVGAATTFADWGAVSGVLGLLGACCVALITFLRPDERRAEHEVAARRFFRIRGEARQLRLFHAPVDGVDDLNDQMRRLEESLAEACEGAPLLQHGGLTDSQRSGLLGGEPPEETDSGRGNGN